MARKIQSSCVRHGKVTHGKVDENEYRTVKSDNMHILFLEQTPIIQVLKCVSAEKVLTII